MPLSTIHAFVTQALEGKQPPLVEAYQLPPFHVVLGAKTFDTPSGIWIYLRAKSWKTKRLSLSLPGTKLTIWQILLTLRWSATVANKDPSPVLDFAGAIDYATDTLDLLPKNAQVKDPVTGRWSTVGLTGDVVSGEVQGPFALATQRQQLWGCPLTLEIKELYTG